MENKNYINNIIPIFILITVLTLLLSAGYAALNQNLSISGEAFLRVKEDVRIISIATGTTENDGYETYSPEYYKKSLKLFNTLPQSNSKIVYNGTINNTTSVKYKVSSLTITSTNSSVECISSLKENDIISVGKNNFTVTASYKSGATVDSSNTNSVCTVNYEFDLFDVTPPTLQAQVVSKSNLTATFKITAQDEEGGSGLSDTNKYQYCFSNNASGEDCTWKNYTSGTSFSETASSAGTYYLDSSYSTLVESGSTGTGDGRATIKYIP